MFERLSGVEYFIILLSADLHIVEFPETHFRHFRQSKLQ